jgi:CubicO group peptidase (beta-lactamase class C family)
MKKPAVAYLFAALLFAVSAALGAEKADPAAARMDAARLAKIPQRMQEFVDAGKAAGIVTLVSRHGHLASLHAVGFQDLETKTPMRTDTMVRIASLTKPITCAGIMLLVDEGRISVLDPVEKYVPEFKGQRMSVCSPAAGCTSVAPQRPVNILDLMTHTSGLPGGVPAGQGPAPSSLAEKVAAGGKLALLFEPGMGWNYSNIGFATLGRIIEVVSKMPYDQFMTERLFTPLGMKDTMFFPPDDRKPRIAAVYTDDHGTLKRAMQAETQTQAGPRIPAPEGGLFSTAADLLRFNQMILNKGKLDGHRMLSAAAAQMMGTSMTGDMKTGFAPGVGHGLGYEVVRENRGTYRYNSVGTLVKGGAYRTYEFIDPAKDLIGIILLQRTNGGGDVADEINIFAAMAAAAIEE